MWAWQLCILWANPKAASRRHLRDGPEILYFPLLCQSEHPSLHESELVKWSTRDRIQDFE
jgi:hypothetical protein